MNRPEPLRGDVWDLDLNPILGREQAGSRPALILSVDLFNGGPAELVVAVPLTIECGFFWGSDGRTGILPPRIAPLLHFHRARFRNTAGLLTRRGS